MKTPGEQRRGSIWVDVLRGLALAFLYIITGRIGLMLALPPGYATIIWPPSGIALGMLLLYGFRLWPGVFLGSFLLNASLSGALSWEGGIVLQKCGVPFCLALGSTLQALVGKYLLERFVGFPVEISKFKKILTLCLVAGPLSCLIASTIGTTSLYFGGTIERSQVAANWWNWWVGDIFGIAIFLPLCLILRSGRYKVVWRGGKLDVLPGVALLVLVIPLGLTFYAWKIASENSFQRGNADFERLVSESEKALVNRLDAYEHALLGGAGFFHGSQKVSRKEWRDYTDTINIRQHFSGISGFGWIEAVSPENIPAFLIDSRASDYKDFKIYPKIPGPQYIIKYVEPEEMNRRAVGLNIAFEKNRLEAANLSRDTGDAAITRRIFLVQDEEKTPGFLLLYPVYRYGASTASVEERRRALRGWIYAPFIAKKFLNELTTSQSLTLNLHIYDGDRESPENLIYASGEGESAEVQSAFTKRKVIDVMQQRWLVVWSGTSSYERIQRRTGPVFILIGGLVFTGLLGLLLVATVGRGTDADNDSWMQGRSVTWLPILFFLMTAGASFYFYNALKTREANYAKNLIEEKLKKVGQLITVSVDAKFMSVKRMAQRWEIQKGTPFPYWKDDAKNYILQLEGLEALEWIDKDFHIRWVEPLAGNERVIGLDVTFDPERKKIVEAASRKTNMTLSPPMNLLQGYKAFLVYVPLWIDGRFSGFMVGVFSVKDFLGHMLDREVSDYYSVSLTDGDEPFFLKTGVEAPVSPSLELQKTVEIYDRKWTLRLKPTQAFIQTRLTFLPILVLIAGLVIAALLALTARYILIARIKSLQLKEIGYRFEFATGAAHIGVWQWSFVNNEVLWDANMHVLYGLPVSGVVTYADWERSLHPEDREAAKSEIQKAAQGRSKFDTVFRIVRPDRAVRFLRAIADTVKDASGKPVRMVGVNWDVTREKEIEQMKNEFISTVSHEIRTPLTSIYVSLELLRDDKTCHLPPDAHSLATLASESCERLTRLINDILDVEKIESGKKIFDFKPQPLKALIEKSVEANRAYAQQVCQVSLALSEPVPEATVNADSDRILQVMVNLISNAAKFSPTGGEVTIAVERHGGRVRVSVSDRGTGIPEEFRDRIFQKFSQADASNTRKKGGTGLGLNICKAIVEKHGGVIGFEPRTGGGTTFYFELPEWHA